MEVGAREGEYQLLVRLKEPVKFIKERREGIVQEVAYKRVARPKAWNRSKQRKSDGMRIFHAGLRECCW
ncbi:MAG: hypothetical protein ACLTZT_10465 [Butyricimonas faecalis]